MQVNDEYLDELFARNLGNMEAAPPEDGWLRIENELNRRRSVVRKFWLAAASFALVLSVTATMVYIQTNHTEVDKVTAMLFNEDQPGQQNETGNTEQEDLSGFENLIGLETQNPNGAALDEVKERRSPRRSQTQNTEQKDLSGLENLIGLETQNPTGAALNEVKPETRNPKRETQITEYIDSWDDILRAQPVKTNNRLELSLNKSIHPEQKISGKNETATLPGMSVYNDITYADVTDISTNSRLRNRWEITGQFAPMQSYRVITGVPDGLRKSDFDDAEKPLPTYSGGITVAYKLFERLSVQTGVFYLQMGQSINDVKTVFNMYAALSSNNSYSKNVVKTSSGSVTVGSNLKSDSNTTYSSYFNDESQSLATTAPLANAANPAKYRLIERIDYIEIPLMLRYRVINRKLSFDVLGGMSTNVLIDNNVFVDYGSELVKSGKILMARPVNYSSTFGLGFGYQITGKLLIGLEPSFKYYLQSYTTSGQVSSNPYAFGLFTGMVYRF